MTGDEPTDSLWGEHLTPFLGWADTMGDFVVEVDRICGQLARLAAVRGTGATLVLSHLGRCGWFAVLQLHGARWTVDLSPLPPPDTACDPYGLEVGAWLASGGWQAAEAHCDDCRTVADGQQCGYWCPAHPLAQDGACRPYVHLDLPADTPRRDVAGRAVDAFARMFGVDGPWDVFLEAVVWPQHPNGIPLDTDLDALRDRRLRGQAADGR